MPFHFLDPGPLIDRELELIPPDPRLIDEVLKTCSHPAGKNDPTSRTTRQQIEDYLRAAPNGRYLPTPNETRVPQYQFWMRLRSEYSPAIVIAGSIGLRIGDNPDLCTYLGHLGYNVYPAAQGHHLAERACRLLLNLARNHGMKELWITCNPDNLASRRTCERLGATFIEIVPLPPTHILFQRGERQKCRYHLPL